MPAFLFRQRERITGKDKMTDVVVTPPAVVPVTPTPGDGDKVTFTPQQQELLNKMFGERAAQGRAAGASDLLKELGFEKADDLKAILKKAKDAEDAQKSEIERAQATATEAERKRVAAAEKLAEVETQMQSLKLRAAIQSALKKSKVEFAPGQAEDDALEHLLSAVKFDDANKLVGLDDALKTLKTDRDYLFAKPETPGKGTPRAVPGGKPVPSGIPTKIGVAL
jgi:hypothetical protein